MFTMQIATMPSLLGMNAAKFKVSKGAKIRNRYNQVQHLTQDTNGKVINLQLDTRNESKEVSPFPAGDHKAHINRRVQRHSKHKTNELTFLNAFNFTYFISDVIFSVKLMKYR